MKEQTAFKLLNQGCDNSISHDAGRFITPLSRLCAFSSTRVPCLFHSLLLEPIAWGGCTIVNFNTEDESTVSLWGAKQLS